MKKNDIKKIILLIFIITIVASAFMGIFALIFSDDFNYQPEGQILLTTITLALFSTNGLLCYLLVERKKYLFLGVLGILFSIVAEVLVFLIIWELIEDLSEFWIRTITSIIIITISFAYSSIILYQRPRNSNIKLIQFFSTITLWIGVLLGISTIYELIDSSGDVIGRMIAVLGIISVLGTLLIPILNKYLNFTNVSFDKSLVFITQNKNKLEDAIKLLPDFAIEHVDFNIPEIQSLDTKEIIKFKLKYAYEKTNRPCFVMDTSLSLGCLNGFPGTFVKWYFEKTVGAKKTCQIAKLFNQFDCKWTTTLGYYDGVVEKFFEESVNGFIPPEPRGVNGYHWDVIFIPEGQKRTLAEMSFEDKQKFAVTGKLMSEFSNFLNKK